MRVEITTDPTGATVTITSTDYNPDVLDDICKRATRLIMLVTPHLLGQDTK